MIVFKKIHVAIIFLKQESIAKRNLCMLRSQAFFGRSKGKAFNHVPKNLQATKANFAIKPVKELPLITDWRDAGN